MVVHLITTIPNLYGIRFSLPNIQKRATAFRPEPDQSHLHPVVLSAVLKVTASDFETRIFYAFTFFMHATDPAHLLFLDSAT